MNELRVFGNFIWEKECSKQHGLYGGRKREKIWLGRTEKDETRVGRMESDETRTGKDLFECQILVKINKIVRFRKFKFEKCPSTDDVQSSKGDSQERSIPITLIRNSKILIFQTQKKIQQKKYCQIKL